MNKLQLHNNKVLKLNNVLCNKMILGEDDIDFNIVIEQMQSYIRSNGALQVGPLIQNTSVFLNDNAVTDMEIIMMLQCNNSIQNVEKPYYMESVIRVLNCMYCRYIGPEDKLKFAYDKIHLEAFENGIELENCNYTIFLDRNEDEETVVVDVFIPRKNGV